MLSNRLSARLRVPAPAFFLVAAAIAAQLWPAATTLPVTTVERVVTVALAVILFDGGMHIGRRRFRTAAAAIVWTGTAGTLVTAAGTAVAARYVAGHELAPGPARRHGGGRDRPGRGVLRVRPAGDRGTHRGTARGRVGRQRPGRHRAAGGAARGARQRGERGVARGGRVPAADDGRGGRGGGRRARAARVHAPGAAAERGALLPPGAGRACWSSSARPPSPTGSGFLAVLVAGILIGDEPAPYKREIARFHSSLGVAGGDRRVRHARADHAAVRSRERVRLGLRPGPGGPARVRDPARSSAAWCPCRSA